MFVHFTGADAHLIPSLSLEVEPGQIVEVPDHAVLPPVYEPIGRAALEAIAGGLAPLSPAAGEHKPKRAAKAKETSK